MDELTWRDDGSRAPGATSPARIQSTGRHPARSVARCRTVREIGPPAGPRVDPLSAGLRPPPRRAAGAVDMGAIDAARTERHVGPANRATCRATRSRIRGRGVARDLRRGGAARPGNGGRTTECHPLVRTCALAAIWSAGVVTLSPTAGRAAERAVTGSAVPALRRRPGHRRWLRDRRARRRPLARGRRLRRRQHQRRPDDDPDGVLRFIALGDAGSSFERAPPSSPTSPLPPLRPAPHGSRPEAASRAAGGAAGSGPTSSRALSSAS